MMNVGVIKQTADQVDTYKVTVILTTDQMLTNPALQFDTPQVYNQIYGVLGIGQEYVVTQIILFGIAQKHPVWEYTFSVKLAKKGARLDIVQGPQGPKGDAGPPGKQGPEGPEGPEGPSGISALGGDLADWVPETEGMQRVVGLQQRAVASTAPTDGQALVWSESNSRWEPGAGGGGGTLDGDVVGPAMTNVCEAIQGLPTSPSSEAADRLFARVVGTALFTSPRAIAVDGSEAWVGEHDDWGGGYPVVRRISLPGVSLIAAVDLSAYSYSGIRDVAVDSEYVYCACYSEGHVAIISKATNAVVGWGSLPGTGYSRIVYSVCSDGAGSFYVAGEGYDSGSETSLYGIFKFSTASCIGASPDTVYPTSQTVGLRSAKKIRYLDGNLFVAFGRTKAYLPVALKFDTSLGLLAASSETGIGQNLILSNSLLYVTDSDSYRLCELNPSDCSTSRLITFSEGFSPCDLASDDSGSHIVVGSLTGYTVGYVDVALGDTSTSGLSHGGWGAVAWHSDNWFLCGFYTGTPDGGIYRYVPPETVTLLGMSLRLTYRMIDSIQGVPVASGIPPATYVLTSDGSTWYAAPPPTVLTGTTGYYNTALGISAFLYGNYNTNIGYGSGLSNWGSGSTTLGSWALGSGSFGYKNYVTAIGSYAGYGVSGSSNTIVGYSAGYASSGSSGTNNALMGTWTGSGITSGSFNTIVGDSSGGDLTTGSNNTYVGSSITALWPDAVYEVVIGSNTGGKGSYTTTIGSIVGMTATTDTWIRGNTLHVGNQDAADKLFQFQNSVSGNQPGIKWSNSTSKLQWSHDGSTWTDFAAGGGTSLSGFTDAASTFRTALGQLAGDSISSGQHNTAIGYGAGTSITTQSYNTVVGSRAAESLASNGNTILGSFSGFSLTSSAENTFVGGYAGYYGTTGSGNVAVGYQALYGNSTPGYGRYNVAVGWRAGYAVTNGEMNVYIGYMAANLATTGIWNVGIGNGPLPNLTTGGDNVAIGTAALRYLASGNQNVAIGESAGMCSLSSSASNIVGIGAYAGGGAGNYSVSIGYRAGQNVGLGDCQVAIGREAMWGLNGSVVSGYSIAIGAYALYQPETTSTENICIGHSSGYYMYHGQENICIGHESGYNHDVAEVVGSIAIGYQSGYRDRSSGYNIAIGYQSMGTTYGWCSGNGRNVFVGYRTGYAVQTGENNVSVGHASGAAVTSGSNNTFAGYQAGDTVATGGWNACIGAGCDAGAATSNAVALGDTCVCTASNTVAIGEHVSLSVANTGQISPTAAPTAPGTGGYFWIGDGTQQYTLQAQTITAFSDAKLKKNVESLPFGLDFVNRLRPRLYDLKSPATPAARRKHMGFVAQELKEDANGAGLEGSVYLDDNETWGVDYSQIVAPLVKAVQELSAKVDALQRELDSLKPKE